MAYITQQIQQFRLKGVAFDMQHLGSESELDRILRDIARTLLLEQSLEALSPDERRAGLTPEKREQLRTLLLRQPQTES